MPNTPLTPYHATSRATASGSSSWHQNHHSATAATWTVSVPNQPSPTTLSFPPVSSTGASTNHQQRKGVTIGSVEVERPQRCRVRRGNGDADADAEVQGQQRQRRQVVAVEVEVGGQARGRPARRGGDRFMRGGA